MSEEKFVMENMLKITTKKGNTVDFILNPVQIKYDSEQSSRDVILKARREGFSSYILGRNYIRCLAKPNRLVNIISHDRDATQRLFNKVKFFIKHTKGASPKLDYENKNEVSFPLTDSLYYVGTAGTRSYGRGDTITDLHCSEFAFWPSPEDTMPGLLEAASEGNIVIESTGNGVGNSFNTLVNEALSGIGSWKLHFYPWYLSQDNILECPPRVELRDDELVYLSKYTFLTREQMYWRRKKIEDYTTLGLTQADFDQEYPTEVSDAFKVVGGALFKGVEQAQGDWYDSKLSGHPRVGMNYVIGVDPAGGVSGDYTAVEVICLETHEQVYEYRSNTITPDTLGERILPTVGKEYNNAYIVVEANNHGLTVLQCLQKNYFRHLIHRHSFSKDDSIMDYGWQSSVKSKFIMVGQLRGYYKELFLYSPVLIQELRSFRETDTGQLSGTPHDDTVIALGCAVLGLLNRLVRVSKPVKQEKYDFWLFDNFLASIKKGDGMFDYLKSDYLNRGSA